MIKQRNLVKWLPFLGNEEECESINPKIQPEENEFNEAILYALSKLSIEERNVLILRLVEEMSIGRDCYDLSPKTGQPS